MKRTRFVLIAMVTVVAMLVTVPAAATIDPGDHGRATRAPEDATGLCGFRSCHGAWPEHHYLEQCHPLGRRDPRQHPAQQRARIPTFCTDLTTSISAGKCFQTAGATACPITWLLNNGYGPSDSLASAEAAARQAAVWYYSDGMTVNSGDPVYGRTQDHNRRGTIALCLAYGAP